MTDAKNHGLLVLAGKSPASMASELCTIAAPVAYNRDEQCLSMMVQQELDSMILGDCDQLVLLKLYARMDEPAEPGRARKPRSPDGAGSAALAREHVLRVPWPDVHAGAVRQETAVRIATEAISFFGPLHGGVVTQQTFDGVIVQGRRYSTAYPHINLEQYAAYTSATRAPVLGAWRARRIQNQRRETRTNRMLDVGMLVLEVSQAVFPLLVG